jgi:hypothetical protein
MGKSPRKAEVLAKATHPGRWGEGRLFWLLLVLIALMVAYPFFVHKPAIVSVFNLLQTAVLFVAIFATCRKKANLIPVAAAFTLFAGLSWLDILYLKNPTLPAVIVPGWAIFYGFAIVAVLSRVSRYRRVTLDEISGAVSAYILLGLFFSIIYLWLELLQPGSFYISTRVNPNIAVDYSDFVLFSFEMLTTLGSADITPLTHIARVVAILESVTGVVYVAVLVGGLVGMLISEQLGRKHKQNEAVAKEINGAKDD